MRREVRKYLYDIQRAAALLNEFTDGETFADYKRDAMLRAAVERQFEIIGEAMARALFKAWFVDFEPVRAKIEGRWRLGKSLPGMPAELYDLFPDRLVDSELGAVPEGWEVGVLDDMLELLSGGTPRTSVAEYWEGDIPWYTAKDAPNLSDVFAIETERTITRVGVENSATKILPAGTTIITARGTVVRCKVEVIPRTRMRPICCGHPVGYPNRGGKHRVAPKARPIGIGANAEPPHVIPIHNRFAVQFLDSIGRCCHILLH